ncbi:MAG: very short patch repair endonuclease [Coriobacteriia bacterium]
MTEKSLSDVPVASSEAVRRRMSRQAKRDTTPERRLRSALYARGHRYRVAYRVPGLPRRTVDIAFAGRRVAVFVDGCFWHGCPSHSAHVRTNAGWWERKITRNRERDEETNAALHALGWTVIRIWEHVDVADAIELVESTLKQADQR